MTSHFTPSKSLLGTSVPYIEQCFDKTTKSTACRPTQFVRFGSARDNNPNLKIRSGQLIRLLGCVSTLLG